MEIIFKNKKLIIDSDNIDDLLKNAWCFDSNNYLSNRSSNINERFHRYIMNDNINKYMIEHNISRNMVKIDHINGNVLDNRKSNLRCVNHSDNLSNRPKQRNNTSGYKGITIRKPYNIEYFIASVKKNGISYRKTFKNLDDALIWRYNIIENLKIKEERNTNI